MSDLFWPGDERADGVLDDTTLIKAMIAVEQAWLAVGPAGAEVDLSGLIGPDDHEPLARGAESGGNPVIGLLDLLRSRLAGDHDEVARWLHRGLTSQDAVDSALMLCARDALALIRRHLTDHVRLLGALAGEHRDTAMVARTLTQHAVPTAFGLVAAGWLEGVLDALEQLDALRFPVQLGGAAGTMAAAVELGLDPLAARAGLAERLGLDDAPAWHTRRTPLTRIGDAAVTCSDAWGHLANDVLTLGRPEIGEVREGGGGGSSTMPGKANPVLSVLVRRAALTAPQLGATLHLASAEQVDQRADGAWHAEWATLRALLRRTVVAASQTTDLLANLVVDPERMSARLDEVREQVTAEQRSMADLAAHPPSRQYLGEAGRQVDASIARARRLIEEAP